jgi:putative transposase
MSIGVDVGIKSFAVTSDGEHFDNPRHFVNCQHRLKSISRSFSRKIKSKKKGEALSKNAEKQKLKLQLLHERVANQRKDFLHKVSTKLIRENQTICIEDLDIQEMLQNKRLSKHIQDAGWGMFFSFLKYKADWYGRNVLTIGRFDPSSKLCSNCGYINHGLKLKDREWVCPKCKTHHDRDFNASINIRDFAFTNINTGSTRNTRKSKPTKYGTPLGTSVGKVTVKLPEALGHLAHG